MKSVLFANRYSLYAKWALYTMHSFNSFTYMLHANESCHTHSCVWHDLFTHSTLQSRVTWLIHTWSGSFRSNTLTWLIHMWHDSFVCDMTHLYVTWLICMWHDSTCEVAHSGATRGHHPFVCDMTHLYVTWLIHMWHDSENNWATGPKRVFLGGSFLEEACRGPHIKRRCCSALQRIAAYCNVLQCVVTHLHAFLHPCFILFFGRW